MRNTIKTQSLILKKRNFGEYDRVLLMLTKDFGRIDVLARGARKPGAKLSGLCESFLLLEVVVEQKRGFDILIDAELVNDYKVLEKNLTGLGAGKLLVEVVEMLTYFGQDDRMIFDLLDDYLVCFEKNKDRLSNRRYLEMYLVSFMMSVLAVSGRLPAVGGCSICGKELFTKACLTESGLCCQNCLKQNICFGVIEADTARLYQEIAMMSADSLMKNDLSGDVTTLLKYCLWLFDLFHKKDLKSWEFLNLVYKNL